ncbi:MAG: hypothetical protein LQ339_005136 [Xanthoria mediterranea]|nr:MAG: hypothetical protein LQ339_005136 [Xanthoria mediterranea]
MADHEGLVDLSLFATSPTDDRHFVVDDASPADRIFRAHPPAMASLHYGYPLPRCYTMKPLPPLPPRKLCRRRGSGGRPDFTSRCILTRMKRQRIGDDNFGRGVTIQQRRNGPTTATPQLTLTLPPSATHPSTRVASAMIWMPDEQMWLTADEIPSQRHPPATTNNNNNQQSAYVENTFSSQRPDYPRSEPSPGPYTYYEITPPNESPVLSQFRSLLTESRNEEMLSPLFQEAIQSVPFSDSASLYSRPSEEFDRIQQQQQQQQQHLDEERQPSRSSGLQSFHSANEFPAGGGPDRPLRSYQRDHSAIDFLAGGPIRPLGDYRREHVGWGYQARRLARSSSR